MLDPERKQVYDQQLLAQFPELLQEAKIAQQKQAEYRQKQAFQAAVKRGELEIRESTNPYFRFDRMPSFLCMLAITFLLGHVLGGVHGLFSRHMEHLAKEQARNPNNIHTACLQFVKTQPLAMQKVHRKTSIVFTIKAKPIGNLTNICGTFGNFLLGNILGNTKQIGLGKSNSCAPANVCLCATFTLIFYGGIMVLCMIWLANR